MVIVTCAVMEDIQNYRISNRLVMAGLSTGLCYRLMGGGFAGAWEGLLGAVLPIIILFPFYLLRGIGAGDVKLLAAAGSYLEIQQSFTCLITALLIGGICSLIRLAMGGRKIHMSIPIFLSVFFVVEGFV